MKPNLKSITASIKYEKQNLSTLLAEFDLAKEEEKKSELKNLIKNSMAKLKKHYEKLSK